MTPRTRIRRRRRSSSRQTEGKSAIGSDNTGAGLTTLLLTIALFTAPLILGGVRLWIELPLLAVVALLVVVQGSRLLALPPLGVTRRADAIDFAVVVFVLYAIVRWLTSPAEYVSRIEVMEVIAYAGVFLSCRYGMANRKYCMLLLYFLVILGVGETIFAYDLTNHPDLFPFGSGEQSVLLYAPRWIGTYESPDHFACFLVMAIGATLALGSFSKLAWPIRIILIYLSLMMIVGVMYSGSRGGWLALFASIVALVTMGIRNGTMRWWGPVLSGAALITVSVTLLLSVSTVARERLPGAKNVETANKTDISLRVRLTSDALRIAHDHPFFGTGPGTFALNHPPYQPGPFVLKKELTRNDYLNCLADYGVIGLGIVIFFIGAVTFKFFRPLWVDNRWQDRVLVATGFAAWLALLAHSLVDSNLHIPANALLLFSLTGLAIGRVRSEKPGHWSSPSLDPFGRWLGVGIILLGLAFAALVVTTMLKEQKVEPVALEIPAIPMPAQLVFSPRG